MSEGGEMNRRSFLGRVLRGGTIVAGLASVFSAVAYFGSGSSMRRKYERLHRVGEIEHFPVGYSRVLKIQSDTVLIARVSEDRLIALSALCPHKGCLVEWVRQEERLACPCHAARFDLTGNVLSGPPQRGLEEYVIDVIGNSIYLKV